jgi:hypothetical protein
MVFTDYLFNLFGYSGPKSWLHHHLNFLPAAIVPEPLEGFMVQDYVTLSTRVGSKGSQSDNSLAKIQAQH